MPRQQITFGSLKLAIAAAVVLATGAVARARADDLGGLQVIYPPNGHVFRQDEDVQLALLFGVETAEVLCVRHLHARRV